MTAPTLRALWRRGGASTRNSAAIAGAAAVCHVLPAARGIVHEFRRMNHTASWGATCPSSPHRRADAARPVPRLHRRQHILMVIRNLRRFTMPELAHEFPLCSELMSGFERLAAFMSRRCITT